MLVMVLEAVPVGLRGELTRWMTPVASTVFVGNVSAEVREALWALALARCGSGQVVQVWSARGEPGYDLRLHNGRNSRVVQLEGVPAIAVQDAAWREAAARFGLMTSETP
jgi:CRISPR-associated protein Cas2